jgi:hypothetical protein
MVCRASYPICFSNPEIAETLRIPPRTIRSRVHRARLFLRGALQDSCRILAEKESARPMGPFSASYGWGAFTFWPEGRSNERPTISRRKELNPCYMRSGSTPRAT